MPRKLRRFAVLLSLVLSALVLTTVPASARTPWWWPKPTPTPTPTKTTSTPTPTPTPTKTTATPTPTPTKTTATPTPTTSTSTPPPSPTCGGEVPAPKADGTNWVCTWNDEFNAATLDSTKWVAQTTAGSGFTDGNSCFTNKTSNVAVAGGYLNLTSRKEAAPFVCSSPYGNFTTSYTSGEAMTFNKFAQMYGRFEIRAKFPAAKVAGLQESLWMYPSTINKYGAWPASGEIDIAEVYSLLSDRAIPFVHYISTDINVTNNYCLITNVNDFHTYTLEWTASSIKMSYDGKLCLSDTPNPLAPLLWPAPFDQPFGLALSQGLGQGKNAFNAATTPLPAVTQVDYVRIWK